MQRLSDLKEEVAVWDELEARVTDLTDLLELAEAADDQAIADEIAGEVDEIKLQLDRLEYRLLLSGEYDDHDAILAVHAGAGGTESQDWTQMLLRMYLRWAQSHDYHTEVMDQTEGEEAGIKSVTVEVGGRHAYGYLKAERGVHRLVRISPFDASSRRHTSFALVEVMPLIDDDIEIEIDPNDLRIDTYRASGAGGQHVNKTSSAVRIVHEPTDIVVQCQNERSQSQNREMAMRILRSRLLELEIEKREKEQARLKGEHVDAGWGNQIRSYVLHPYHMVKDHRTSHETGKTQAVLDGDIDAFIMAYLKSQVGVPA
ncbi:MAG: Peptide chain release factor 2 [Anaerolineales bacterium]|nr:Peptide chain release factor 2 [Anaerolineales bacterium]